MIYNPPFLRRRGKCLGDYAEGDIILLNENGLPVEFYVACHNYESGLNQAGRTLVVRKDCYDGRAWHKGTENDYYNAYANCSLDDWFNNTYKKLLDSDIRTAMGVTTFYYTPGSNSYTYIPGAGSYIVTTLKRPVFALSITELGCRHDGVNVEGAALPIASTLQVAYLNGSAAAQWTRSPYHMSDTGPDGPMFVGDDGIAGGNYYWQNCGSRPVFTLPAKMRFDPKTNMVIA